MSGCLRIATLHWKGYPLKNRSIDKENHEITYDSITKYGKRGFIVMTRTTIPGKKDQY